MTDYYIRFKKKVNEMLAKEIWVPEQTAPLQLVQQFRSKLRLDFESKLTDYLEDKDIDQDDLTLEEFFQIMLKIEKRLAIKQKEKPVSAPIVPGNSYDRKPRCVYCEQLGHVLHKCPSRRKGINHAKSISNLVKEDLVRTLDGITGLLNEIIRKRQDQFMVLQQTQPKRKMGKFRQLQQQITALLQNDVWH